MVNSELCGIDCLAVDMTHCRSARTAAALWPDGGHHRDNHQEISTVNVNITIREQCFSTVAFPGNPEYSPIIKCIEYLLLFFYGISVTRRGAASTRATRQRPHSSPPEPHY